VCFWPTNREDELNEACQQLIVYGQKQQSEASKMRRVGGEPEVEAVSWEG